MIHGNQTDQEINVYTNIKGGNPSNTGALDPMTSPITKPLGENESPGALSSMKFKSEARNDLSRTEHLDQIANANGSRNQNLSGVMSNTME